MTIEKDRSMMPWRIILAAAALWTLLGAVPAFLDTAATFNRFHGYRTTDHHMLSIYRGSWGQSMLFAIGYLIAAFNPVRHAAIVALGAVGKIVYAAGLVSPVVSGSAGPLALPAVIGDFAFAVAFIAFLLIVQPWRNLRNQERQDGGR